MNCTCKIGLPINKQCPVHGTIENKNDLQILEESYPPDANLINHYEQIIAQQAAKIKELESQLNPHKHIEY